MSQYVELGSRPALLAFLVSFIATTIQAQNVPEPYFCNGYKLINDSWEQGNWDPVSARPGLLLEENCPDDYAFVALKPPIGRSRRGAKINPVGRCCRLPDGVLTGEHSYELEECPADSVATGARAERHPSVSCVEEQSFQQCMKEWESTNHYFRCTKLNTPRFRTGRKSEGLLSNLGSAGVFDFFGRPKETSRSRIPLGIRYGVTWGHAFGLQSSSFVGFPWGSLVVGKKSNLKILFAPIEFTGELGDPPNSTLLKIYPDCVSVTDPIAPMGQCLTRAQLKK